MENAIKPFLHVFIREYPFCDIAKGLNGDPPIL